MTGADDPSDALQALPLFPLPGTVFFPHTLLPLHIFEPRYRAMTEDVLAGDKLLGVVNIDDDRGDAIVSGVAKVAGLGRVVHHERLSDGRFHLLLQGVGRAELLEELSRDGRLYRRARARLVRGTIDEGCDAEVRALRACYARLLDARPEVKDVLGDVPLRVADGDVLADVVLAAVLVDTAARQAAMEENSARVRLQIANEALATLLLQSLGTERGRMH